MTSFVKVLKRILTDLATLKLPVTAAAVVALVTQVIPGLHVNSAVIAGILVGVGIVAQFVLSFLAKPTA